MYVWSDGDKFLLRKAANKSGDYVSAEYRFEILDGVSHWMPRSNPIPSRGFCSNGSPPIRTRTERRAVATARYVFANGGGLTEEATKPRFAVAPAIRPYQQQWLRADILAGLAAGAVVIPQAMAYATVANMPVQFGLYTCMLPLVVYAFIGGSRTASVTTTSTIATLSASTMVGAGIVAGSNHRRSPN